MTWEHNTKLVMSEVSQLILMLKEKGLLTRGDIDELAERAYKGLEDAEEGYRQYLVRGTKKAFKVIDGEAE